MTYRQIETSRELRLWTTQVLAPAVTGLVILMSIPEVRHKVKDTATKIVETIKRPKQ